MFIIKPKEYRQKILWSREGERLDRTRKVTPLENQDL